MSQTIRFNDTTEFSLTENFVVQMIKIVKGEFTDRIAAGDSSFLYRPSPERQTIDWVNGKHSVEKPIPSSIINALARCEMGGTTFVNLAEQLMMEKDELKPFLRELVYMRIVQCA